MPSFLSRTVYEDVSSGIDSFALSFPYLLKAHVIVGYNAPDEDFILAVQDVDYEFTSSSLINWITPRPDGVTVTFRRSTPNTDLLDRLTGGSTVNAAEQEIILFQLLYLIQEALDAGLSLETEEIGTITRSILTDLRWNYDIALGGFDAFSLNDLVGPVTITRQAYLPAAALGSQALTLTAPTGSHVFDIRKHSAGVTTVIGTLTLAITTGAPTWSVASDVTFAVGDALSLKTTTQGLPALANFGTTLRLRRTDVAL